MSQLFLLAFVEEVLTHPVLQEQQLSPPAAVLLTLFSLGLLLLGVFAASSPRKVVRLQARFSRGLARANYGQDWERVLEALGQREYAEYLRRAPEQPDCFPSQVSMVQILAAVVSVVASLMLIVAFFLLIASSGGS